MNKNIRLKIVRHEDRTEWVKKQLKKNFERTLESLGNYCSKHFKKLRDTGSQDIWTALYNGWFKKKKKLRIMWYDWFKGLNWAKVGLVKRLYVWSVWKYVNVNLKLVKRHRKMWHCSWFLSYVVFFLFIFKMLNLPPAELKQLDYYTTYLYCMFFLRWNVRC